MKTLINNIILKLEQLDLKISFAESMTGGNLASCFTNENGSSKCFEIGYVTYSNDAKTKFLNVTTKTIDKYGVISKQIAYEMARGLRIKTDSDINISITGNSSNVNAQDNMPKGLSYICILLFDKKYEFMYQSEFASREEIKVDTTFFIFKQLWKIIEGLKK